VHPRLGTVDVVPFVPLGQKGLIAPFDLSEAIAARNEFSRRISESLSVPCFLYGPERSLPDIRRSAFHPLLPDVGPKSPHPRAGAICVGARNALVAYNVEAEGLDIHEVKKVASAARSEKLRTLGFDLTGCLQVSCNLVDPWNFGIEAAFDTISREVIKRGGAVGRAELVGLMPEEILMKIPKQRWEELGVDANSSIEARLSH
jgi:glutamate formiminotransferase